MSDAEIYVGQCLLCFALGLSTGMLHRWFQKFMESVGTP